MSIAFVFCRLDRLFILLDTGSTPLIRKSAAEQIGLVLKLHPTKLSTLLNKVPNYILSRKAICIECIDFYSIHTYRNTICNTPQVQEYLGKCNWETRIAAGQAVNAICSNVPVWQQQAQPKTGVID